MSHPTVSSNPRPSNNWNQKTLDANSKITEEINTARELQQNMRPQMKAIVGIPYLSGAISFNGDLAKWVEKNTSPNDQENSFLKWQADILDDWDTSTLYNATNSTAMTWAVLGLTDQMDCQPEDVYLHASAATYNRFARVFWQHILFDLLAHMSGISGDQPRKIISNTTGLCKVAEVKGAKAITGPQISKQYSKQYAQDARGLSSIDASPVINTTSPNQSQEQTVIQTTASNLLLMPTQNQSSETQTTASGQLHFPRTTTAHGSSDVIQETFAPFMSQIPTRDLYRSIPRDVTRASRIIFDLLESVDIREKKLAWPHTLNNFALAGATLSWLLNNMFAIRIAMGNINKPFPIELIERSIWRAVIEIAVGVDVQTAVLKIVNDWESPEMRTALANDDRAPMWFRNLRDPNVQSASTENPPENQASNATPNDSDSDEADTNNVTTEDLGGEAITACSMAGTIPASIETVTGGDDCQEEEQIWVKGKGRLRQT
ncbi:uncharacterized protein STEHIDRAFT_158072 [Stereum hirsutum FP-91666 SS1]|uniref:uncharacterized protein n=1 Tax=Stereum hirsutum (strain FP-91666) TaxID=721885 RepID=UPI000444A27C|nr:uncharacterized protein STEHIDRAFT_158072 [Stereum hirsutum FP-91666 SS1]EIM85436.1 hypothetical protein STEHIDRAFT_158072 [Stereum hirsutum FP-91666 SS1]